MERSGTKFGDRLTTLRAVKNIVAGPVMLVLTLLLFVSLSASVALADSAPPGLVLWNKLGSANEVLNSAVGPNLAFFSATDDCAIVDCLVAYTANPEFVPGKFGNALTIGPGNYDGGVSRVHNVVLRNAQNYINTEHGTVEVWFRQTASGIPYLYGDYRVLDGAYGFSPGIVFGTNDLVGNGHFVFQYGILFGGQDIEARSLSNGEVGYDISPYNGQWIHIAGVWDRNGIAGTADTLRLYVNGNVVATATDNGWGTHVGPVVDIGGGNASEIAEKFAVDNLKLWNIAKTDFSDRLTEGGAVQVRIDIDPNSAKNVINLHGNGKVAVAILGTATFDVNSVDGQGVRFGPGGALPVREQGRVRDVNRDGYPDLLLKFAVQDTNLKSGNTQGCVTGSTTGGVTIEGCDTLKTNP